MGDMTDEEFIRYCDTHCESPRAGFIVEQIVRILTLAGETELAESWKPYVDSNRVVSVYSEVMKPLCERARQLLLQSTKEGNYAVP